MLFAEVHEEGSLLTSSAGGAWGGACCGIRLGGSPSPASWFCGQVGLGFFEAASWKGNQREGLGGRWDSQLRTAQGAGGPVFCDCASPGCLFLPLLVSLLPYFLVA